MNEHLTRGAIKAAEIITGHRYDPTGEDQKRFDTEYGSKTVMGIAAIIDRHSKAPELVAALDNLCETYKDHPQYDDTEEQYEAKAIEQARAALAATTGDA